MVELKYHSYVKLQYPERLENTAFALEILSFVKQGEVSYSNEITLSLAYFSANSPRGNHTLYMIISHSVMDWRLVQGGIPCLCPMLTVTVQSRLIIDRWSGFILVCDAKEKGWTLII